MRKYLLVGVGLLVLVWGASAIGSDDEIKSALSISASDLTRLQVVVGRHQSLGRNATTPEAISELKSRINEFVRREEAKVDADTLGQWGGI